jgi:phytoene synthase
VYLPAEQRARHGVTVQDIAERRMTDGLRTLLAAEVSRARRMFASGTILHEALHPTTRPGVRLACSVYERVLDRVEALGFDVLSHPVRVPPWQLGAAGVTAVSTPAWRRRNRRAGRAYR